MRTPPSLSAQRSTDASGGRLHTAFSEVMAGRARMTGRTSASDESVPMILDLDVRLPELLHPFTDAHARLSGRVRVQGLADDPVAVGDLHIAPLARRRVRYRMDFTALDGRRLHLDGWKSVSLARPLRSMTTLPVTITDQDGAVVAEALLRFDLRGRLWPMLRSLRVLRETAPSDAARELRPRWSGERGRLEVWYTTLTDPRTGTGVWIHHELVAPHDGAAPYLHGWAAVFPPGGPPHLARFGPEEWRPGAGEDGVLQAASASLTTSRLDGRAGDIEWELAVTPGSGPLFTFPRWAWNSGLLPAAQIVPHCGAAFTGSVRHGGELLQLSGAPGAPAHIYGHGNAHRWAWLHADLGGGDVAEIVTAVSTRPGLRRLPPLPFVRLRIDGRDWPQGDTLLAATRLRSRIGLPTWRVWGRVGDHRLRVEVTQPPAETVDVGYTDPDGATAVCHNTERATADIRLERRRNGRWEPYRSWRLDGTAHAEVGLRD